MFIGFLHDFEEILNELMPLLTSQIQKKEYCCGDNDKTFDYYKIPLIEAGKKVIAMLTEKNIYKHPKFPNCGSTNTKPISNVNRAASVAMWGLASSKIGKQYKCN